jgi:hypothetical protein
MAGSSSSAQMLMPGLLQGNLPVGGAQLPEDAIIIRGKDASILICKCCRRNGIVDPRNGPKVWVTFMNGVCLLCYEAAGDYYLTIDQLEKNANDEGFRAGLLATIGVITKVREKSWAPAEVVKDIVETVPCV